MLFSSFKWRDGKILYLDEPSSAYIYYLNKRVNLLTGLPEAIGVKTFFEELAAVSLGGTFSCPRVYHFYYELGLIWMGLSHEIHEEMPLAVVIDYEKSSVKRPHKSNIKSIGLQSMERPTWTEYKEAFQKVQEHLLNGDCYQVNLTYPFDFLCDEVLTPWEIRDFFLAHSGTGSFAHVTSLGEELIVSNSPECLFDYRQSRLFTMPIKGTLPRTKGPWKKEWKELLSDKKQEGELLMIVDLLRNDLNRMDQPHACVHRLRAPLVLPSLLHQYALLSAPIKAELSLLQVMKCLFPGGSITGAPKKRVMMIIQEIERGRRGIYCGSTLLCWGQRKVASINIRTASVDPLERWWRYGAGGGITLLSRAHEEFREMEAKLNSFLTLIKAP